MSEYKVLDISAYQTNIFDVSKINADGVILRLGYTALANKQPKKDDKFDEHYKKLKAAGIPVGVYYFTLATNESMVDMETKWVLEQIKSLQLEFPVWVDCESQPKCPEWDGLNKSTRSILMARWCRNIQNAGYYTGIYANRNWLNNYFVYDTIKAFDTWIAVYGSATGYSKPYGIWQYSSSEPADAHGITHSSNKVDINIAYKDYPTIIRQKGCNHLEDKGMMTAKEYVDTLIHIVNCPTEYSNKYPRNLGYWDGSKFSFDCWNMIKAVINGWKDNRTVGYYQKDLSKTGDIDGLSILNKCTKTSKDFTQLNVPGAYLFMRNDHAGTYVGEHTIDGKIVNVIECTSAWNHKVQWSYVDAAGNRYNYKGGSKSSRNWTDWGLMCWIDYSENAEPAPVQISVAKPTLRKGSKGSEVRLLQSNLMAAGFSLPKYGADGEYGNETADAVWEMQKKAFPNNPKEWDKVYGPKSATALKEMLELLG